MLVQMPHAGMLTGPKLHSAIAAGNSFLENCHVVNSVEFKMHTNPKCYFWCRLKRKDLPGFAYKFGKMKRIETVVCANVINNVAGPDVVRHNPLHLTFRNPKPVAIWTIPLYELSASIAPEKDWHPSPLRNNAQRQSYQPPKRAMRWHSVRQTNWHTASWKSDRYCWHVQ